MKIGGPERPEISVKSPTPGRRHAVSLESAQAITSVARQTTNPMSATATSSPASTHDGRFPPERDVGSGSPRSARAEHLRRPGCRTRRRAPPADQRCLSYSGHVRSWARTSWCLGVGVPHTVALRARRSARARLSRWTKLRRLAGLRPRACFRSAPELSQSDLVLRNAGSALSCPLACRSRTVAVRRRKSAGGRCSDLPTFRCEGLAVAVGSSETAVISPLYNSAG